MTEWMGEKIIY